MGGRELEPPGSFLGPAACVRESGLSLAPCSPVACQSPCRVIWVQQTTRRKCGGELRSSGRSRDWRSPARRGASPRGPARLRPPRPCLPNRCGRAGGRGCAGQSLRRFPVGVITVTKQACRIRNKNEQISPQSKWPGSWEVGSGPGGCRRCGLPEPLPRVTCLLRIPSTRCDWPELSANPGA